MEKKLVIIGSSDIALRPEPDKKVTHIGRLTPGTTLVKIGEKVTENDLWYNVRTEEGVEGWCVQRYAQEV